MKKKTILGLSTIAVAALLTGGAGAQGVPAGLQSQLDEAAWRVTLEAARAGDEAALAASNASTILPEIQAGGEGTRWNGSDSWDFYLPRTGNYGKKLDTLQKAMVSEKRDGMDFDRGFLSSSEDNEGVYSKMKGLENSVDEVFETLTEDDNSGWLDWFEDRDQNGAKQAAAEAIARRIGRVQRNTSTAHAGPHGTGHSIELASTSALISAIETQDGRFQEWIDRATFNINAAQWYGQVWNDDGTIDEEMIREYFDGNYGWFDSPGTNNNIHEELKVFEDRWVYSPIRGMVATRPLMRMDSSGDDEDEDGSTGGDEDGGKGGNLDGDGLVDANEVEGKDNLDDDPLDPGTDGVLGTGTPGDGTQVDRTPGDGTQVDRTPGDGTQVDRTPGDGTQVDRTPGDGTQVDRTPGDGTQVDRTPGDGTQVDRTPGDGTQVDRTPGDGTQVDRTPGDGTQVDRTPGDGTQVDRTPGDGTQVDRTPGDGTQVDRTPGDDTDRQPPRDPYAEARRRAAAGALVTVLQDLERSINAGLWNATPADRRAVQGALQRNTVLAGNNTGGDGAVLSTNDGPQGDDAGLAAVWVPSANRLHDLALQHDLGDPVNDASVDRVRTVIEDIQDPDKPFALDDYTRELETYVRAMSQIAAELPPGPERTRGLQLASRMRSNYAQYIRNMRRFETSEFDLDDPGDRSTAAQILRSADQFTDDMAEIAESMKALVDSRNG